MLKNEQKFELVKEKQKNAEKTQETMLKKTGKMQKNQMLKKTWHNSGPPWTTPTNKHTWSELFWENLTQYSIPTLIGTPH